MLTYTDRTWHAPECHVASVPIAGIGAMRHGSIVHKKSCRTDRRSPVTEAKLRLVNMGVVIFVHYIHQFPVFVHAVEPHLWRLRHAF